VFHSSFLLAGLLTLPLSLVLLASFLFFQTIFGLSFITTEDADKFVAMLSQLVQMLAATQPAEPGEASPN
jgi:hypothetical protein